MVIKKELNIDITKHILVPKHTKLNDKEREELLKKYNATEFNLPKILKTDATLKGLELKTGDIIKIERDSPTAGDSIYYRAVM